MHKMRGYAGKKVLVTGGTGFVGTNFTLALLAADANVRIAWHQRKKTLTDARLEYVQADLANLDDCRRVMRGMTYVVHAAGYVSAAAATTHQPANQMSAISENLVLTTRCLQAAWLENIERFLLFGSSTAYPPLAHAVSEDELWSGAPFPAYSGYGWMRRYTEKLAEFVAQKSALGIAVVRPTAIYGRYDNFDPVTSHVVPGLIRRAVAGENPFTVWGDGNDIRDMLHVSDFVRGSLLALEHLACYDPVNIGAGEGVSVRQLVAHVLKAAGREDARVIFDASKPSALPYRVANISKAKQRLGFVPQISLEEGIHDTVAWFKEHSCKPL